MFALKHSADMTTAGSFSLVQRQSALGSTSSQLSSSLDAVPSQHSEGLEMRPSGSVDSRVQLKRSGLQ